LNKFLLAAVLGILAPVAQADVFDFSYASTINGTVAGKLAGTLQPDGNVIVVTSILDFATLNDVAGPSLPGVYSNDSLNFGTAGLSPRVSLNGAFMDFLACSGVGPGCPASADSFTFNAGNVSAATPSTGGVPFYATSGFYGGGFGGFAEGYDSRNWHISAVPEPAIAGMFGLGVFVLIGAFVRKSRAF